MTTVARLAARVVALTMLLAACTSGGGVAAAAPKVAQPPKAGVFDYQIGGAYRPAAAVRIVDRDRSAKPAAKRYNICYVNAFQTQPEEKRFWTSKHRSLLLRVHGRYVTDPDWPGEYVLDTSTAAKRAALVRVVGAWFDGCARKGFDAVEPDNLDSWTRRGVSGAITKADNLAYARALVKRAHARGLAIAQKNTVEVSKRARSIGFDFAIAEECEVYRECGGYTRSYGARVLEVEYTDTPRSAYTRACTARAGTMSIILRDRDVVPRGNRAYRYSHC
ncbi:Glycoside-hydrolase family GH114 [Jatrophihabitans endophyticus]|uniref:Glycoside-hydrolase family GH114 n=1 Tax=Jatrophihabitans endophyticus TaxID=1206085 RepID=A0A1M5G859_9ACTN|nr:endo alpha-1,4 polygalactosaminidase [Jatrophihabitans endophyticus]SHF99906.1 Glycoside-hydrolase family GH114 [Jatrophihabitans endophyticus]